MLRDIKKLVLQRDKEAILMDASNHPSVSKVARINWLRVWEEARDRGPFWSKIAQQFYKLITTPLFGNRECPHCSTPVPEEFSLLEHFDLHHSSTPVSPLLILDELASDHTVPFQGMRSILSSLSF